jgi:branched-subunit amino acid aminotransferase/4-amino-4-deoxychorismate lyase
MFVYVKDNFFTEDEATISIKERGFRFGDGVFETIRVEKGISYQLESHLKRLNDGLKTLKIELDKDIEALSKELIEKNTLTSGILRISVSRGIGSKGYLPRTSEATMIIETSELSPCPSAPVDLWFSSWQKPSIQSLPVNSKLMQGVNSTLARMEAEENNCFEAIQLNNEKYISECSSSNIFWIKDEVLYTPELECGLVAGTTRDAIIRLSPYKVKQGQYEIDELSHADEVFICNVAWQVLPVKRLKPLGFIWDKFDKTEELQQILTKDIEDYVAARNT